MSSTDSPARRPRRPRRPQPLAPLGPRGKALWDKVTAVDEVGRPVYVLRVDDGHVLELAARALDRADALLAGVDLKHPLCPGSNGQLVLRPEISEARMLEAQAAKLLAQLRLPDVATVTGGADAYRAHQRAAAAARWGRTPGAPAAGG